LIFIEQITEPTPELRELIGELDTVLNAAYEPHQRHGLNIAQLFDLNVAKEAQARLEKEKPFGN